MQAPNVMTGDAHTLRVPMPVEDTTAPNSRVAARGHMPVEDTTAANSRVAGRGHTSSPRTAEPLSVRPVAETEATVNTPPSGVLPPPSGNRPLPPAARAAVQVARAALASRGTRRGLSYSTSEVDFLLDTLQEIQPIGGVEWEAVSVRHNDAYPSQARDSQSLRRKFNGLVKVGTPTGDPTCPPHVRRAKRIMKTIGERCDAAEEVEDTDLGVVLAPSSGEEENIIARPMRTVRNSRDNNQPDTLEKLLKLATLNMLSSSEERKEEKEKREQELAQRKEELEERKESRMIEQQERQERRDIKEEERREENIARRAELKVQQSQQQMMMMMMMDMLPKKKKRKLQQMVNNTSDVDTSDDGE